MTDNFLPSDYSAPAGSSNYMKLLKGENRFRIMGKPIVGYEDWTADKKPVRFRMADKPTKPITPTGKIRHFWAFPVWDYTDSRIKILEITQSTIQSAIQSLSQDADWGSPFGYDIKVIRTGDGMETEYTINPVPHKEAPQEAKDAFKATPIHLEALYDSEDPFSANEKAVTENEPF